MTVPLTVCLVHGTVSTAVGSGRYIYDLSKRFAADGCRVLLVCHECETDLDATPNIEVVRVARSERPGIWRMGFAPEMWSIRAQVRRQIQSGRFDVLIGSDLLFLRQMWPLRGPSSRFIYTPLSMIAPLEIESYGLSGPRAWIDVRLYTWLQRWALEACDRVVRFTSAATRALERYYGLDLTNKAMVAVYVSQEFEQAGPSESGLSFERPTPRELLWVGRLVPSKNVSFLLRAVSKLRSTDWILNVCSEGPDLPRLEALARSLGIESRVRFLGRVSDMASAYRRASVLLTASVLEQYSLTLMEAYGFGVPCIGIRPDWRTVFNSNEDQIEQGETGYVVGTEEEMAERIDYLLTHEQDRQRMARRGHALKSEGFSFESYYQALKKAATGSAMVLPE